MRWNWRLPGSVIEMRRAPILYVAGAVVSLASAVAVHFFGPRDTEVIFQASHKPAEAASLCPWRDPKADLQALFPTATRYERETHILSGLRLELTQRLGRSPHADENALQVYRVYGGREPLGSALTRRVKGTYGAIEIVLGVDQSGRIAGLRLQRLREPESVSRLLEDQRWLASFKGQDARGLGAALAPGGETPILSEARASAQAIVDGARSLLVLLEASERPPALVSAHSH
jgi:hypothetical protein